MPPTSILVAWCPHCAEFGHVLTPEQKAAERIGPSLCAVCKQPARGRRWCMWVEYALPVAGVCRACGCTELDPCPEGCGWADRSRTLCTACTLLPPAPARDVRAQRRAASVLARRASPRGGKR